MQNVKSEQMTDAEREAEWNKMYLPKPSVPVKKANTQDFGEMTVEQFDDFFFESPKSENSDLEDSINAEIRSIGQQVVKAEMAEAAEDDDDNAARSCKSRKTVPS